MLRNNYEISAHANNYDLENIECHSLLPSCEIWSTSPRFANRAVANLHWCFQAELLSPTLRAHMWFDWRPRHNGFRYLRLRSFRIRSHLIVASQSDGNSASTMQAVCYCGCFYSSI